MKKIITAAFFMVCMMGNKITMAQTKLGVVNTEEVFAMMPETKKADSSLEVFKKALADDYSDSQKELNALYLKFVADSGKMTKSLKDIKRADLQSRVADLSQKEQRSNDLIEAEKERLLQPIREKLIKTIEDVAKEAGYTHVAYKSQMIYYPAADDISDRVKKKLGIK